MSTSVAEQYQARLKRVMDAVNLKEPDRVPIAPVIEAFPAYYSGTTIEEMMYDYDKAAKALDKFYSDFTPDLGWDFITMYPAKVLEILDIQWCRWPGKALEDPNAMFQYVEHENLLPEEYAEFNFDPTHFMMTKWIPRSFGKLQGLSKLNFRGSMWFSFLGSFGRFADPAVRDSLRALMDAGEEIQRWFAALGNYNERMKTKFGIPTAYGSFGYAPFDMLGDTLRGTVPIFEDLYDRPEELLEAVDRMLPIAIEGTVGSCPDPDRPFVWIWLHKGIDSFMSDEFFKKFYWPTLQKYIFALVENNMIPVLYVEGSYNRRLEILRDVPKGKVVYDFETIDMKAAKRILGDVACIAGNVPNSLLSYGKPAEVEAYCKGLIDVCAPGGGYFMDTSALVDDAKPENMEAMFNTVFKYGCR